VLLELLLLAASLDPAQRNVTGPSPARPLEISSERSLGVPVFSFSDLIQSDKDGNLFFHAGGSLHDPTLLKISTDGSTMTYRPPTDLPKDAYFRRFYVTRSGQLYSLIAASNGAELFVVPYRSNGSPQSILKLPPEGQVAETEFAVFENGNIVLGGFFHGPESFKGKRFRYLLNRNGELVKKLETAEGGADLNPALSRLQAGGIAEADDGSLYTLVGTGGGRFDVYTIGTDGSAGRKFSFKTPDMDFVPLQLFVDSTYLAAVSHKRRKNAVNAVEIFVVDLATGETIGHYTPPEQAGNMLVHFSVKEGFKFLKARNNVFGLVSSKLW
jgi:hypothetical protein